METVAPPQNLRYRLLAALKRCKGTGGFNPDANPAAVETSILCDENLQETNNYENSPSAASSQDPLDLILNESSPVASETYQEKNSSVSSTETLVREDTVDETDFCCVFDLPDSKEQTVDNIQYDYGSDDYANLIYDKWSAESGYNDYMLEEYIEVDGQFYEVIPVLHTEAERKFKDHLNSDENLTGYGKTCYEWSEIIVSEDDRNKIYDKWMEDLETWERNRLMWLEHVDRVYGFDSSCEPNQTFLVKVDSKSSINTKLQEPQGPDQAKGFQSKFCLDDVDNSENATGSNTDKLSQTEKGTEIVNIPHDLTTVYRFTNRNIWRIYQKCY